MRIKPAYIIGTIVIITFFGLVLILSHTQPTQPKPQQTAEQETVTPQVSTNAAVAITLSPSKPSVQVGEQFAIQVTIDTASNTVGITQLALQYDPNFIAIDKIDPGTFFASPAVYANTNDRRTGMIMYAIGSFTPKKGKGLVANLSARAVKATNGSKEVITVLPTTIVTEPKNQLSVFKNGKGASLVIN